MVTTCSEITWPEAALCAVIVIGILGFFYFMMKD